MSCARWCSPQVRGFRLPEVVALDVGEARRRPSGAVSSAHWSEHGLTASARRLRRARQFLRRRSRKCSLAWRRSSVHFLRGLRHSARGQQMLATLLAIFDAESVAPAAGLRLRRARAAARPLQVAALLEEAEDLLAYYSPPTSWAEPLADRFDHDADRQNAPTSSSISPTNRSLIRSRPRSHRTRTTVARRTSLLARSWSPSSTRETKDKRDRSCGLTAASARRPCRRATATSWDFVHDPLMG